ncbi:hypothetical protein DFJ74DRAFT_773586, partial [Hyaloraphidium curvatum]
PRRPRAARPAAAHAPAAPRCPPPPRRARPLPSPVLGQPHPHPAPADRSIPRKQNGVAAVRGIESPLPPARPRAADFQPRGIRQIVDPRGPPLPRGHRGGPPHAPCLCLPPRRPPAHPRPRPRAEHAPGRGRDAGRRGAVTCRPGEPQGTDPLLFSEGLEVDTGGRCAPRHIPQAC